MLCGHGDLNEPEVRIPYLIMYAGDIIADCKIKTGPI